MKFFLKELATKIFEGNTEECVFARQLLHVLQEKLEDPRMDIYIYIYMMLKATKDGCLPKN
jgi:CRISPR/Cas system Type II protein with McrA/HNH and RuvC-like nuclease domain